MIFNQKKQHIDENFTLHDRQIAHTESYTHIGIDRKLRGRDLIEKRIKLARRTNGTNSETKIVIPVEI
jgi:hypothetical protein